MYCKHGSSNIFCAQCDKDLCDWYDYSPAEAAKRVTIRADMISELRGGIPKGQLFVLCAKGKRNSPHIV